MSIQLFSSVLLLTFACFGILPAQSLPAPSGQGISQERIQTLTAVIDRHCVGCHSEKLRTAAVVLERQPLGKAGQDPARWEKVLRKVRNNEMPPAGAPQPTPSDRAALTGYLEAELDRAGALHPNPGRPTAHRLNRIEYVNAVRDLAGVEILPSALPQDDTGYGFDNIADVLSLSPVLVERYLSSARKISRTALGDTKLQPIVNTFDALAEVRASRAGRIPRNERISEDLPFGSARGLSLRYTFPVDAEYLISVKLSGGAGEFGETAPPVGEVLDLRIPIKAGPRQIGLSFLRTEALPETGEGGRAGRGSATGQPKHLDLRLDGALLKRYDVSVRVPEGKEINQLAISGPYNITGPGDTESRRKILVCRPASRTQEDSCAEEIFRSLGRRAYRRPLTGSDLAPLMALYRDARAKGGFEAGIENGLVGLLVSPRFLFRIENDPPGAVAGAVHRLNDFELASRLSFFLWSTIPDDGLLQLAEQGKLFEPAVLRQQVARMLNDPKSNAFVDNFAGQWLMLRNLDQLRPDPLAFPKYDYALRRAFGEETRRFFDAILRENRPVTELLNANFTFVNQRLAEFYGIPGIYGPRFRRVELRDSKRSGLLGQGSILTLTSYPNRTSVVQRGRWILDSLLASPPPPPPPDIPALELEQKDRKLSVREAMEAHRANAVCAACHARMDPIGFAMENYDGIGEWRDWDGDAAIDVAGKLPDGTTFNGVDGLKRLLLTRYRDQFLHAFLEKLMTYALGRGMEAYDQPAMRRILRDAAHENSTIPSMIHHIVESDAFLMRRNPDL